MVSRPELAELVAACREAARPVHDLVISGEGNASFTTESGELYVTASGSRMASLTVADLIPVDRAAILAALRDNPDDATWAQTLRTCSPAGATPSVEVGLHAVLSASRGPGALLHTHPTSVLALLLAGRGPEPAEVRVIPDQVVMCGRRSWLLPYLDPGHTLAGHMLSRIEDRSEVPSVILLGHHGIVTAATTGKAAFEVTTMTTKAARILIGSGAVSQGLDPADITRIAERADERHRQAILGVMQRPQDGR